jgi:hypothetical protein
VTVLQTLIDSSGAKPIDVARVKLATTGAGIGASEERLVREGAAFNWRDFHIAVVAVYGPGELGADMRLRIPHPITHVTLHHTGTASRSRAPMISTDACSRAATGMRRVRRTPRTIPADTSSSA